MQNNNLKNIVKGLLAALVIAIVWFTHSQNVQSPNLGAISVVPTPVALFETTLSNSITSSATTFTLTSATDKDGNTLATSTYAFIIDEGTANEEFVTAECVGTSCTNAQRGISVVNGTAEVTANKKAHRRGASVKITDGPQLLILSRLANGTIGYENPLKYSGVSTTTLGLDDNNLASVGYANALSFGGIPEASEATAGFVELATAIEAALGTSIGSTGARLVLPASLATSTPSSSSIPVSDSNGKIDSLFILPAGTILAYGSSTAPTGWLNTDGSAISRTTYSRLFAVIGTSYGAGDGSTTFNLPDLKSRFPLGYSATAPTKVFTFASRSSDTITVTSDVLTNSTTNELQTGQKVNFVSSGTTITGLTSGVDYYLIRVAYNQFKLATSVLNANAGTAVTLSGDGTGTRTFTVTYTARAIGSVGGTETDTTVPTHTHATNAIYMSGGTGDFGTSQDDMAAASNSPTGSDAPNNMPLFTVVNYIINY